MKFVREDIWDLIVQAEDKIRTIQEHLRAAHNRQKNWANSFRRPLELQVGEHVFLKISPTKGVILSLIHI